MKADIHPKYQETKIRCACGNLIETGSTKDNITVEICSACASVFHRQAKTGRHGGAHRTFPQENTEIPEHQ